MRRNFVIGTYAPPSTPPPSPVQSKKIEGDVFALPVDVGMPIEGKEFDAAVKKGGGHFVTIKPSEDTYMPVYYRHGKSYAGKVHHVKKHHKRIGESSSSDSSDSSSSSENED